MSPSTLFVACLCAEWCGVCRDYRSVFEQVRARIPEARFIWVDIEDQSDLVDPVEVDDFPTLLIAQGEAVRFFGPMIPRAEQLERAVRAYLQDAAFDVASIAPPPNVPAAAALLQRLSPLQHT